MVFMDLFCFNSFWLFMCGSISSAKAPPRECACPAFSQPAYTLHRKHLFANDARLESHQPPKFSVLFASYLGHIDPWAPIQHAPPVGRRGLRPNRAGFPTT